MAIDFSFPEEIELIRQKVREYCDQVVRPAEKEIAESEDNREVLVKQVIKMRKAAQEWGLWLPHMPEEYGGMGLGHVAMAAVSAEAAKTRFGPFAMNAQAPDEGNMHTLLHWATPEQAEKYLRPLCDGKARSCFAMTEPEVAGSDPTLIQTRAALDGDHWVINGHKWFISGAQGAQFAILIARTEENPEIPKPDNSALIRSSIPKSVISTSGTFSSGKSRTGAIPKQASVISLTRAVSASAFFRRLARSVCS